MRYQQIALFGKPFLVDPDDSLGLVKWGVYEKFQSSLVREVVKGKVCWDIGAHIGYYTALMLDAGAADVTAFEANPFNTPFLYQNCGLFGVPRDIAAFVWEGGISDKEGWESFYLSPTNSGDDTLYPFDDVARLKIRVHCKTIDGLGWTQSFNPVDFIKMDIQGGEIKALRGAEQTLARGNPMKLAVEFFPDALRAAGDNPIDLLTILRGHGFKLWEIREDEKRLDGIGDAQTFCDRADLQRGYTNIWAVRE